MKEQTKTTNSQGKPANVPQENILPQDEARPFPIAGIGASAGGLEAELRTEISRLKVEG
jgi:chemotaxis response regulator CheB